MQTHLPLGHLCVAKPGAGRVLPSYPIYGDKANPGKITEQRIICKAVAMRAGKEIKRAVGLRLDPQLLKNYLLANGSLEPGHVLNINITDWTTEVEHNAWMERAYFLITTDTLTRSLSAQEVKQADQAADQAANQTEPAAA